MNRIIIRLITEEIVNFVSSFSTDRMFYKNDQKDVVMSSSNYEDKIEDTINIGNKIIYNGIEYKITDKQFTIYDIIENAVTVDNITYVAVHRDELAFDKLDYLMEFTYFDIHNPSEYDDYYRTIYPETWEEWFDDYKIYKNYHNITEHTRKNLYHRRCVPKAKLSEVDVHDI